MTYFISGAISADPHYREKFAKAAKKLEAEGHVVLSPHILPLGLEYAAYIRICAAMLIECQGVYFLTDWKESGGAPIEHALAEREKKIMRYEEDEDA
jgi:hypothetical protein